MSEPTRTRRRLLTASLGIAAYTALEGLACGNPVAPACPQHRPCSYQPPPEELPLDAQPTTAPADAGIDAAPAAALVPTP